MIKGFLTILAIQLLLLPDLLAQENEIILGAQQDLNILFPELVRVFESNGYREDDAPYQLVYKSERKIH